MYFPQSKWSKGGEGFAPCLSAKDETVYGVLYRDPVRYSWSDRRPFGISPYLFLRGHPGFNLRVNVHQHTTVDVSGLHLSPITTTSCFLIHPCQQFQFLSRGLDLSVGGLPNQRASFQNSLGCSAKRGLKIALPPNSSDPTRSSSSFLTSPGSFPDPMTR